MSWGIVASAGASLIGGAIASNGAKKASKAQAQSADAATAEQKRQYDISRADQMPWLNAGKDNLGYLNQLNSGDYSRFTNSPDYKYGLDEMTKNMDRSAASRGRLYSGGYGEDFGKAMQGYATTNYNNYYNRLSNLAGVGQTAAQNLGGLGANYANNAGQNMMAAGNARASGYQNQSNAWGNAFNQVGGLAANYFGGQPSSSGFGFTVPRTGTTTVSDLNMNIPTRW
jgi:hypothetical protein